MNRNDFQNVTFKSVAGDEVTVTMFDSSLLFAKFANFSEFVPFTECHEGWYTTGCQDYSIKMHGDDIFVSKGFEIGRNKVLYKRVQVE